MENKQEFVQINNIFHTTRNEYIFVWNRVGEDVAALVLLGTSCLPKSFPKRAVVLSNYGLFDTPRETTVFQVSSRLIELV
jgi:hypothetical protein